MRLLYGTISTWLVLCFSCVIGNPSSSSASEGELRLYWIDTEGGAATLMVTPAGESVLVDSGNPGLRDSDRIAKLATREAGLKRIDHLITTHYHRDHFGGAALLSTMIPIGHVHDNGSFEGMPDQPDKAYWDFKCDQRSVINPGATIDLKQTATGPEIKLLCLGTRKQFIDPKSVQAKENREIGKEHRAKDRDGSDNANSVVLLLSFGNFRFYDAGDLTWNQEVELVNPFDRVGAVDVYQVTHHGLDASNNPVVLKTIKPTVAVMNNGPTKGCMPDVVADLRGTSSIQAIYQLHKNLRPNETTNNAADEFIANHEATAQCQGHAIHLTVTPDAKTYSVSIPSGGHRANYTTTQKDG